MCCDFWGRNFIRAAIYKPRFFGELPGECGVKKMFGEKEEGVLLGGNRNIGCYIF